MIQKHAATRLHYDFRLELDGVLKSWAVPKGPSLDPSEKRLAVETEDHPIEYGGFEGVIPEGQYGGGAVLLWDRGTWEPRGDPRQGLRQGKLVFTLRGEKLRGGWALIKLRKARSGAPKQREWLLIKEKDATARAGSEPDVTEARSVETGRDLEQVARDRERTWSSDGEERPVPRARSRVHRTPRAARSAAKTKVAPHAAKSARRAAFPRTLEPQLATLVAAPPAGDEWLHEMKFDGYRILARLHEGRVLLRSRAGHDWTGRFPAIARVLADLPARRAWIDGEVTAVLSDGTTSFAALQNAGSLPDGARLVYFAFDLPYLGDSDLREAPLEERKRLLRELLPSGADTVRYSDHLIGDGERFLAAACRMSLEGAISKRRGSPYQPGRGSDWTKTKCHAEQEVVIGGFTEPKGSRQGIGALLVGVRDESGALRYAGKVGTGFTTATALDLRRRLERLVRRARPFTSAPGIPRSARFVEPRLVAQVRFTEWTRDGRMRHPSFAGLREDKEATQVTRERPVAAPASGRARVEVAGVALSHPERVVFARSGETKADLARYYERMAPAVLPQLEDRPLTLVRCPEGAGRECFFVKHAGAWAPRTLPRVRIQEKTKRADYLTVDSLEGLIGLVQMNVLELHTWNARAGDLERPDRIVFDLDPGPGVAWARVAAAAASLRERLARLDLESFVKTTGGKGLHVVVPLLPRAGWDECLELSRAVSESLEREQPEAFLTEMAKAKRPGRILIDYARNHRGSTSVAAFSTRSRPTAPVSLPVAWEELPRIPGGDAFTLADVDRVLSARKRDPWAAYGRARQSVTAARLKKAHAL